MKHSIIIVLSGILLMHLHNALATQWSTLYAIDLHDKKQYNVVNNAIVIEKKGIPSFSQLILGFNGKRPKENFSFYVQAHDPVSKKWGKWHKLMDWGSSLQRSYMSPSDNHTYGAHVRLEVEKYKRADGFKIKIQSKDQKSLKLLKNIYVTAAYEPKFSSELFETYRFKRLPSIKIMNIPRISQMALDHEDSHRICSPTSCSMVTTYLQKKKIDPIHFAKEVFDDGLNTYGNWPFNTAQMHEHLQRAVYPTRVNSFSDLHKQLLRGIPVIVSVRGSLAGAPKPYQNGHLMVVMGWDSKKLEVICHDPAFTAHHETEHRYPVKDFIQAWELSKRLVYWITERNV